MSTPQSLSDLAIGGPSIPIEPESDAGQNILNTLSKRLPSHFNTNIDDINPTFGTQTSDCTTEALRIDIDPRGATHIRLRIKRSQRTLFGEHLLAQIQPDGKITFFGTHPHLLNAPLSLKPLDTPANSPDDAERIARNFVESHYACTSGSLRTEAVELVEYRHAETIQPAYYVRLADFCQRQISQQPPPLLPHVLVDTDSDQVLLHWDQCRGWDPHPDPADPSGQHVRHITASTRSLADDYGEMVGFVQLHTTLSPSGYELRTPDNRAETRDAQERDPNEIAGQFSLGVPFLSDDDSWGGKNASDRIQAAVETHYAATAFLEFLQDFFGLESLDNRGLKLRSLTNIGTNYNNAFWYKDVIHIGHGDRQTFGRLSTIDIIGHELAHGITEKSAGLIYNQESGGLNESYSDIVGTLFEWWNIRSANTTNPDTKPFDWRLGEDTFTPTGSTDDALRFMDDPLADGKSIDHYSNYHRHIDVHYSSGIQNHAFYLAVEGGQHRLGDTVEGLKAHFGGDMEQAMRCSGCIWMHALQYYLQPSSLFSDAKMATLQSARDLFPDDAKVLKIISDAWNAVGVTT